MSENSYKRQLVSELVRFCVLSRVASQLKKLGQKKNVGEKNVGEKNCSKFFFEILSQNKSL